MSFVESQEKILQVLEGLLRLSKSDNLNEAAVAMAKAQQIATKYQIDLDRVDPTEREYITKTYTANFGPRRFGLLSIICRRNAVRCVTWADFRKYELFGRKRNIEIVEYIFEAVHNNINALALDIFRKESGRNVKVVPDKWFRDFYTGATEAVRSEFQKAYDRAVGNAEDKALAVQEDKNVEDAFRNQYKNLRSGRSIKIESFETYNKGYNAGKSIRVGMGIEE